MQLNTETSLPKSLTGNQQKFWLDKMLSGGAKSDTQWFNADQKKKIKAQHGTRNCLMTELKLVNWSSLVISLTLGPLAAPQPSSTGRTSRKDWNSHHVGQNHEWLRQIPFFSLFQPNQPRYPMPDKQTLGHMLQNNHLNSFCTPFSINQAMLPEVTWRHLWPYAPDLTIVSTPFVPFSQISQPCCLPEAEQTKSWSLTPEKTHLNSFPFSFIWTN